jgi:large subunit ribosomal protein L22
MKTATAKLNNYRHSPRKVRLVADLVRGKKLEKVLSEIKFLSKKASLPLEKLINSAVANAKGMGMEPNKLFIKKISVDAGPILYRRRFRARGRVMPIRKRTSHISLVLEEEPMKTIDKKLVTNDEKSKSKSNVGSRSSNVK